MLWRQNQLLNGTISAMEKSNLELERANLLLEINLKTEQHLKLEWKKNYENSLSPSKSLKLQCVI